MPLTSNPKTNGPHVWHDKQYLVLIELSFHQTCKCTFLPRHFSLQTSSRLCESRVKRRIVTTPCTRALPDLATAEAFESFQDEPYLDPSRVRLEASGRVFCSHAALDGAAVHPDFVLLEAQFWQAAALTHVQLCMHQVHTVGEREEEGGDAVNEMID